MLFISALLATSSDHFGAAFGQGTDLTPSPSCSDGKCVFVFWSEAFRIEGPASGLTGLRFQFVIASRFGGLRF